MKLKNEIENVRAFLPNKEVVIKGNDVDFNQSKKVRIYREDVYKIISEGDNIKVPPIKLDNNNFK